MNFLIQQTLIYAIPLMIVALAVNTVFISIGVPQLLRQSILFTSTLCLGWLFFAKDQLQIINDNSTQIFCVFAQFTNCFYCHDSIADQNVFVRMAVVCLLQAK